jgi:hypothetical protein
MAGVGKVMAIEGNGTSSQLQWPNPQTIEEAINQVRSQDLCLFI